MSADRKAAVVMGLLLVAAPGAARGTDTLRGDGLSFPLAMPGLGQALELVGQLDPAASHPPFTMDSTREYTWSVYGSIVHTLDKSTPGIVFRDLTFGVIELREDPARNSGFPPNPPNATVPSSFHDGTVLLLGKLTDLRIQDVFGIITATGSVLFDSGSGLGALGGLHAWGFHAAISPYGPGIPPGYGSHWNLELTPIVPVGVEALSWGGIKALYR